MEVIPCTVITFLCVINIIYAVEIINVENERVKECYGTHVGFGMSGNQDDHYESLRRRYKDCTHVEGNLEITHVDKAINSSYDISFLSSIEIVTGYVLLGLLEVEAIPLINLRLIRADSTYNIMGEEYGLVVALTSEAGDDPKRVGLRELQLSSLKEISKGKVFFAQNPHLCYVNTIDWTAIVPGREQPVRYGEMAYSEQCEKECDPECESFGKRRCWGESRFMCQIGKGAVTYYFCRKETTNGKPDGKSYRVTAPSSTISRKPFHAMLQFIVRKVHSPKCHPSCPGRCYDSYILGCCHPECAIGCYGPSDSDCEMCKYFQFGNRCVPSCPGDFTYRTGQECLIK